MILERFMLTELATKKKKKKEKNSSVIFIIKDRKISFHIKKNRGKLNLPLTLLQEDLIL